MKKIIREILALVWKLLRVFVIRWLRDFLLRFAKWGALALVAGLALATVLVLLISSC